MCRVFSVNYDLRAKAKPDYAGLFDELQNSHLWWHYLESTWLIATPETAAEVWNCSASVESGRSRRSG